ncbi:MAG: NAD(+) synthase [Clostridiales bacterium]|nr:NAD(+) synthase [Clostridiales bacterium]
MFDAKKATQDAVAWIRNWFEENGKNCNAIVGISGGKDSSVVASLCVEALGKERVIGVLMPNGTQPDIDCSKQLVEYLGIPYFVCNIQKSVDGVLESLKESGLEISRQTLVNLPPRIRMSTLYAVSQSKNGRVANTCNLSEDWVGYSTRYGDSAGDFAPIAQFTVKEVKEIGKYLNLPLNLVEKVPSDGLSGKTDEDNLGFTYAVLDKYIREGVCEDAQTKTRIDYLHKLNAFKLKPIPAFPYQPNEQ